MNPKILRPYELEQMRWDMRRAQRGYDPGYDLVGVILKVIESHQQLQKERGTLLGTLQDVSDTLDLWGAENTLSSTEQALLTKVCGALIEAKGESS